MIPKSVTQLQPQSWQYELQQAISDPKELFKLLKLPPENLPMAELASRGFPLIAPHAFVKRIKIGDLNDPLLKQLLPQGHELDDIAGYSQDPLQEEKVNPLPGLLQKFRHRVLLTVSQQCAIHCRYCFRRSFSYSKNNPGKKGWQAVFDHIRADKEITEVILSGGDPLILNDKYLAWFFKQLTAIKTLKTIRLHTRLPIMIPNRITPELVTLFSNSACNIVFVIHCNHSQEIDQAVVDALAKLQKPNIHLLNQSVLLRGINDTESALSSLQEAVFGAGVLPYYLHLFDPVQGAHHFDVDISKAKALMRAISATLPGYLVPKLVREVPGAEAKMIIDY